MSGLPDVADHIASRVTIAPGVDMPWLGLGVFQVDPGQAVRDAVTWALEAGYRRVDTASLYRNEEGVGEAIAVSGVPDVFVTTKVWNTDQGYDSTLASFEASRRRLGRDIDLFLVHWPNVELMEPTWRALEKLHAEGNVRAIGVSNFMIPHLEQLFSFADVPPALNQVELHPRLQQGELVDWCRQRGILVEAWSPLMRGRILDDPTLGAIAAAHGKTPAQVIIRWLLQRRIAVIPRSVRRERIFENADVFDFELDEDEMAAITAMDRGERIGPVPGEFF